MASDFITVKINNWKKHNRNDVQRPTWFSCSNTMIEDDDLFTLTGNEFKAWIHLLSKASQKQKDTVNINFEAALRKANIKEADYRSAIKKLELLQIVAVVVTDTLRDSDEDVSLKTDKQTDKHTMSDESSDEVSPVQNKKPTPQDLVDLWNEHKHENLAKVLGVSKDRERTAKARLIEYPDAETWSLCIAKINASEFLTGKTKPSDGRKKAWKANFDWLIRPGNVLRVLEGNYDK